MKTSILLILLFCVIGGYSHAVLLGPSAWWKTASRERPCGGADYNPIPSASWAGGSKQTLRWWVIAGDGTGPVRVKINPLGDDDFSHSKVINVTVSQPEDGFRALGIYYPNITVPSGVKCTGPGNTCTMQVFINGGGGWYSCATINITCAGCNPVKPPIAGDQCVVAKNLKFCSSKNGGQVVVPAGQTALQIDTLVKYPIP